MAKSSLITKGAVAVAASTVLAIAAVPGLIPGMATAQRQTVVQLTAVNDEAASQEAVQDPFGGGDQDPFGGGGQAQDPFGGDGDGQDPFRGSKPSAEAKTKKVPRKPAAGGTDPFGGRGKSARGKRPSVSRPRSIPVSLAAREVRILTEFDKETNFQYVDQPLMDVVTDISFRHAIPIVVDTVALEDYGIGTDSPVSINLQGVSLKSALRLMLNELDLTYVLQHEVLQITTAENADKVKQTHVYKVDHLVEGASRRRLWPTFSNRCPRDRIPRSRCSARRLS